MTFANCNDHNIHYQWEPGDDPRTLVFINSLGTDLRIWDSVVAGLKGGYSILRFDKRGHGLSEVKGESCAMEDYASDILALTNLLDIDKFIPVGLSIGGMITLSMVGQHPERLEKMVLSNTGPKVGTDESWNGRITQVKKAGISSISSQIVERWFSSQFKDQNPGEFAGYRIMLEQTTDQGYVNACGALRDADYWDLVDKIEIPSLCIGGSEDLATPPELLESMHSKLIRSEIKVIDGVAHLPCLEKPQLVTDIIENFIRN